MRKKTALRLALAAAGVCALALGVSQGQYRETLTKAIYLCLECVGLG